MSTEEALPVLSLERRGDLLQGEGRALLEQSLPGFLRHQRWFGGKERRIESVRIDEEVPLDVPSSKERPRILLVSVLGAGGDRERYALPLAAVPWGRREGPAGEARRQAVALLSGGAGSELLVDGFQGEALARILLGAIAGSRSFRGAAGQISGWSAPALSKAGAAPAELPPSPLGAEQTNTSIRYGDRYVLKFIRRIEDGTSLDLEIGRFLTEKARFPHTPPVLGALEYRGPGRETATLAILQGFVRNRGDAWSHTQEALGDLERGILSRGDLSPASAPCGDLLSLAREPIPEAEARLLGPSIDSARLLGRRTAELHRALSGDAGDPDFAPEPFTAASRDSLLEGILDLAGRSLGRLREAAPDLPAGSREEAWEVLQRGVEIPERLRSLRGRDLKGLRIRCHGDYHLGQVLFTGSDFSIIDFEGEPARPLAERREKRSPLKDVAGMIRSFHYAASSFLLGRGPGKSGGAGEAPALEPWLRLWYVRSAAAFLGSYLERAAGADFLAENEGETRALLDCFLLEKAVYELGYELSHRPDWVRIPLQGILDLLG